MRIGIYARVSTKDQSCEMQLRDLRTYCAARGLDLVREYIDVGQSGAKDSCIWRIDTWADLAGNRAAKVRWSHFRNAPGGSETFGAANPAATKKANTG